MKASTQATSINGKSFFKKDVHYFIPYDLGVTFGSIYDSFRKWIKKDLKNAVIFNTEYIKTQLISEKEFLWNKGLLAQAKKPCLSIQGVIDHAYESEVYRHPSMKNWDAVHFLEPEEFTHTIINIEDNLDMNNNLAVRIAMKSIQLDLTAGIVAGSRNQSDNIANYWTTRRSTNYYYPFDITVDFKIPDEVITMIQNKFKLQDLSHHQLLKWLNRNSKGHIYYAMDGYSGKDYYFFRYVANPLIKVLDMNNPTEYEIRGNLKGESYAFTRSFELEVMIPSIIAIKSYGDRIDLSELSDEVLRSGVTQDDALKISINRNERYIEIEKTFENKHMLKEVYFNWSKDDLVTHRSGEVTTKEISLFNFFDKEKEEDQYIFQVINWAKSKGYNMEDIFSFQLFKIDKDIRKEAKVKDVSPNSIPEDAKEKKYYIKNMRKFSIVDLKPVLTEPLIGIIYINLLIKNQYEYEIGRLADQTIGNDDMGIILPYGPSKSTVDTEYK